jgi:hypothetical protein
MEFDCSEKLCVLAIQGIMATDPSGNKGWQYTPDDDSDPYGPGALTMSVKLADFGEEAFDDISGVVVDVSGNEDHKHVLVITFMPLHSEQEGLQQLIQKYIKVKFPFYPSKFVMQEYHHIHKN